MGDKEKQFVNDLLEASLRNYSGAEPRAGLEGRVLAGVRARQQEQRRRTVWLNALATAGLAAILGVVALRVGLRRPAPAPAIAKYPAKQAEPTVATVVPPAKLQEPRRVTRHAKSSAVDWRPQQFPTPRPLSEQEKLLVAYVQALHRAAKPPALSAAQDPQVDLKIQPLTVAAIKIEPLAPDEDGDGK